METLLPATARRGSSSWCEYTFALVMSAYRSAATIGSVHACLVLGFNVFTYTCVFFCIMWTECQLLHFSVDADHPRRRMKYVQCAAQHVAQTISTLLLAKATLTAAQLLSGLAAIWSGLHLCVYGK
mmetsp:Transcript_61878/g.122397  ORF Transcript_61878/g.122397 Transcript_61878/m.122397 type:complete len:126 (-) Transcript_61878:307-684(-)